MPPDIHARISEASKLFALLLIFFVFANFTKAQAPINNTCNTAITISNMPANDWDTATFAATGNLIWFTFTTGIATDSIVFKLDTNITNPAHIHKIVLFDDCNNLSVLKLGAGLVLTANVNANTNYVIAVERAQGVCGRAFCQQVEASFRYNLEERKQEDCVGFTFNGTFIPLVIVNPGYVAGLYINNIVYLPDNCSPLCFSDCDFFLIPPVWLNDWTFTLTGPNTNISGSGFSAGGGCFNLAVGTYTFTATSTVMYPGVYTSTIVILPPQTFPPVTPNFNNAPYCSAADMVANTTFNNLAYYHNMFYNIVSNNQTLAGSPNINDLSFVDLCQGTYSLQIVATDYCDNTYSWQYPFVINYGVAFDAQMQNCLSVNITNITQCPGSIIYFEWDMGDGNIIAAFEPGNYTYATEGNYVITLYAYNAAQNCQPEPIVVTQHITVTYGQQLQITGPENTCCVFNNSFSMVNPSGFSNFQWTVPNFLSFSGQGNPQISVNWPNQQPSTQPWAISVTATGAGNCELSATFYVEPCCYNCEILESMPLPFNNKKIETDFCSASYISQLTDINGNPLPQVGGVITLSSNTGYFPNQQIIINNDLYIDQNTFMDDLKLIKIAPGKKIVVMPGVTFTANQCEMSYTCRKMWKGVEIMDNTATFICSQTTISHAEHAIESFNGGVYKVILESKLENCYKGIVVNPYNGNHQGEVWQSFIQMQNPNNTLICPYLDKVTHTGIEITDVANIQVGIDNAAANKNTIRRIQRGITSYRSNLTVYNNEFTNINDPNGMICFIKCPCQIGTAVCAYSDGFTYSSLNIGGTQANQQNRVRIANIGVHVSNNVDANIVNNEVRDIDMEGIKIDFNWGATCW